MSEYKGMYQRNLERNIAAGKLSLFINWLNMSEREAMSGGADRCTELLLAAGYRPDGSVVREDLREKYENGVRGEDGRFIRAPQETWTKGGAEVFFSGVGRRRKKMVQYDYRATDGELFPA